MKEDELQKELDNAAVKLLQNVASGGTDDGRPVEPSSEQAKVFSAVVEWYKTRPKAQDAAKESPFVGLKREFHGQASERPRGRGRPPKGSKPALSVVGGGVADASPDADRPSDSSGSDDD